MKRYEGRIAGILGTVIIHLIAAIIFFTVNLQSLKRETAREFVLIFENTAGEPEPKLPSAIENATDEMADVDRMIRNIVRNLSDPNDPVIDPQEYQDRVKEELINKGLLGEDNFIDQWKRRETEAGAVEIAEQIREEMAKQPEDKKPVNYQGPTRVYFRLENRYHTFLPIPVYKCPSGGKVTVIIEVDRKGSVISAKADPGESTTSDPCLIETAVASANISRFNADPSAPASQSGTITFHFVPQ